jgi:hypothetical protein
MSRREHVERWALRLAGVLVLAIGIGHAFLPTLGYPASATAGMTHATKDHFYYLGTYSIGTFLLAFAVLSFLSSNRPARAFSIVMAVVWTTRLALEVVYPVNVQISLLQHPTQVIEPLVAIIAAAYLTASIAGRPRSGSPRPRRTARPATGVVTHPTAATGTRGGPGRLTS